ncbi:MAG TPA: aminotransferase class V-fold PLP-dependent enzyme [Dehalococcoidia bacterium]
MNSEESARLYSDLGVRPVINAAGAYTILGGSQLSAGVQRAMEDANRYFVELRALLESSGRIVSSLLDCEAAYVTSGAASALALSTAACMTGSDPEKIERLPDTSGMKDEVLIQRCGRLKYDRCVTIPGARLVEFGGTERTTTQEFEAAFTERTCAVHFLATGTRPGSLPLVDVIRIAHEHAVPVIVDAAGQTYPTDELKKYARVGADLVCYAAKYFNGPHSTGLITGRRELVEAAAMNGFVSFETNGLRTIGRPMKVDRQEIIALVVALQEWFAMNHEERYLKYGERADAIMSELKAVPGIKLSRMSAVEPVPPVVREAVRIEFEPGSGRTAEAVEQTLQQATPAIWTKANEGRLYVSVAFFNDGEESIVAERLREALTVR